MPSTWATKYLVCNSSPWRSCWSPEATSHKWDRVCPQREYERLIPHSHHSCQVAFRWHFGGEILAEDWRHQRKRQRRNSVVFQHSLLGEICWITTRERQRERDNVYLCVWLLATFTPVYPYTRHWSPAVWRVYYWVHLCTQWQRNAPSFPTPTQLYHSKIFHIYI